jgi:hypothetical protein
MRVFLALCLKQAIDGGALGGNLTKDGDCGLGRALHALSSCRG